MLAAASVGQRFFVALWGNFIRPPAPFCDSRSELIFETLSLVTEVRLNPACFFLLTALRDRHFLCFIYLMFVCAKTS